MNPIDKIKEEAREKVLDYFCEDDESKDYSRISTDLLVSEFIDKAAEEFIKQATLAERARCAERVRQEVIKDREHKDDCSSNIHCSCDVEAIVSAILAQPH